MTLLIIVLAFILLAIIIIQISRINEIAKTIRGEEQALLSSSRKQSRYLLIFMVLFLFGTIVSAYLYKNYMLGYGPHTAASEHGPSLDRLFNVTLAITGIVFVITHIALFYFGYKYSYRVGQKATFMPHDNKLEIIWTAIPAFAMFALVINGLIAWNDVMADVDPDEDYMEIEATGYQFAWILRYPGEDGKLGSRDFRKINSINPLGQDWTDIKNLDDIQPTDLVLPVNKKVRVRITARDVLHDFYLPHFRLKMDAVPGLPTFFVFTPTITTEEYREQLAEYPEYQVPADPTDPNGPEKWEQFDFELACAELCGSGHYSMRKRVIILEQAEYDAWLREQNSYYLGSVRGTKEDPFADQLLQFEIDERNVAFEEAFETALEAENPDEKIIQLEHVYFETGSAQLTPLSQYELDNIKVAMQANPSVVLEISGHTDNTGDPEGNQVLSQQRADAVFNYIAQGLDGERIIAVGYGQSNPIDSNDTEEGRVKNRRTEIKIISQ
ncbi:MAG: OmpA family protein [Saprospiraceae bacterium]|nr:OmpA family protein [Saprospiraceae bacterium]